MTMPRREFLSISATLGASVLISPLLQSSSLINAVAGKLSPNVHILRIGHVFPQFEKGVLEALSEKSKVGHQEVSFESISDLTSSLGKLKNSVLIGMMSDRDHVIFNEAIRETGSSFLYESHHTESVELGYKLSQFLQSENSHLVSAGELKSKLNEQLTSDGTSGIAFVLKV